MVTDSFIVHVKTSDIYKYIGKDVEKRFEILNFETDRPLPKGKKSNCTYERSIRRTNHERICWIKGKNL